MDNEIMLWKQELQKLKNLKMVANFLDLFISPVIINRKGLSNFSWKICILTVLTFLMDMVDKPNC